ncbi:hypothetical protein [Sinomonas mesophila]|uniref:hypothetical protein n=1 Tax=Sinomonas mesophila TaxID=1531955 RepID=UPI0011156147|nr:hypothetical protein [Sinomonas mesophila]
MGVHGWDVTDEDSVAGLMEAAAAEFGTPAAKAGVANLTRSAAVTYAASFVVGAVLAADGGYSAV